LLRQVRIVDVDGAVQVSKPLTGWNGCDSGEGADGEGGEGGEGGYGEGGDGGDGDGDGEGGDGGDGDDGEGGDGGGGGDWTISTGQPRGTPRQLVEASFVVVGGDAFPAAAMADAAWAVAADAGGWAVAADAEGWASGARRADSSARRLVPVVAPPGGDAGADWAVDTVPAGASRSV
jgi:hypothetical protein